MNEWNNVRAALLVLHTNQTLADTGEPMNVRTVLLVFHMVAFGRQPFLKKFYHRFNSTFSICRLLVNFWNLVWSSPSGVARCPWKSYGSTNPRKTQKLLLRLKCIAKHCAIIKISLETAKRSHFQPILFICTWVRFELISTVQYSFIWRWISEFI